MPANPELPDRRFALLLLSVFLFLLAARATRAQGGPPLLTNDPGTPGNGNWEINLGVMPVLRHDVNQYQLPQLDINFGLGDRIQLTAEVPFIVQTVPGQARETGWGNTFAGVKWRFFQDEKSGWQISTFPQFQATGPPRSVKNGVAEGSSRVFLPIEITKAFSKIDLNFEVGYFFAWDSHPERILGFAAGHQFTPRLELIGEVYNDRVLGALPHDTTFDAGGRFRLGKGFILLFMAGRSFSSNTSGQPNFLGYLGLQILLKDYGKRLQDAP
ncbi:MAG: hypothetical protein ACRD59_00265 [Candidatus Acidiferrales bacterium]